MAAESHAPIIVPVADLQTSYAFYISALRTLGYQYISQAQHQGANRTTQSIGLGPANTTRIDVLLSQKGSGATAKSACHLIFSAPAITVVREFYAAALNAGGRVVLPPTSTDGNSFVFTSIVSDLDGNEIEVCYTDPTFRYSHPLADLVTVDRPVSTAILKWRDAVADQTSANSTLLSNTPQGVAENTAPRDNLSRSRRNSNSSSKKSGGSRTTGLSGNKAVVGTLVGAAAGVALLYALNKEPDESAAKGENSAENMSTRRRAKTESKARDTAPLWREKSSRSSRRRSSYADRDSGYYSPPTSRRDPSPDVIRYRAFTYPAPSTESQTNDRRGEVIRTVRSAEAAVPSQRSRPYTHVTVSSPPSKPPRPSLPGSRNQPVTSPERYATSKPRTSTKGSTTTRTPAQPDARSASSKNQTRSGGPAKTKTIRYVPMTRERSDISSTAKPSKPTEPTQTTRDDMPPPGPPPDIPPTRSPEHYIDQLDLDDATVIPDDSISCVSTNPGRRHRAPRPKQNKGNSKRGKGAMRRMEVAY